MKKILFFLLLISTVAFAQPYNGIGSGFVTGQSGQTASGNNIVLAVAGTGSYDALNFNRVSIQIIPTGTVSSGVITFEGSNDNTNFVTVPLFDEANVSVNPVTTVSPATSVVRYLNGVINFRYFRARISTIIGGGGSLQAITSFSREAYQPDITPTGQDDLFLTGQAAQTATINNIIPSTAVSTATDLTGYRSGTIQVTSTGSGGTFIFEGSNDNVNFQTIPVWNQLILTGSPITSAITATSSQIIYVFPIQPRYIRLRIATTITGGSIQAHSKFMQVSFAPAIQQVATTALTPGTAAANLGKAEDAVPASGDTGVGMLGIRQDGPTLTNPNAAADYGFFAADDGAAMWVRQRPLSYNRLTADGQVKATAGHLQTLTFSPTGTVVAGVITIYDSATETGTAIFSCSLPVTTFTPFSVTLNVAALTAIYVGYDATVTNVQVTTTFR